MKYSPELTEKICGLISEGKHTIADVCKQAGITEETFYQWKKDEKKPEFSESLSRAYAQRTEALGVIALSGLAKRLDFHEYIEETQEYTVDKSGKKTLKVHKATKKRIPPSDRLIEFTLKNADPEHWKDKHILDHTTGGAPFKAYAGFDPQDV